MSAPDSGAPPGGSYPQHGDPRYGDPRYGAGHHGGQPSGDQYGAGQHGAGQHGGGQHGAGQHGGGQHGAGQHGGGQHGAGHHGGGQHGAGQYGAGHHGGGHYGGVPGHDGARTAGTGSADAGSAGTGSTGGVDLLPAERGHLDSLDGLRAIASILVVVFHVAAITAMINEASGAWQIIAHGDVGVPIFFALSGLLLYRPWVRWALDAGRTPDTRAYLWRRALRILPAYWAVVAIAMFAFNREQVDSSGAWTEWLSLIQVYDLDPWWKGTGPEGLGQMWSLSTEVTFYLLLPAIGIVLGGYARLGRPDVGRRAKRLLFGITLMTISSFVWVTVVHETDDVFYYELWLPKWMGAFAVGMAMSVLAVWARQEPDRPNGPVGRFCRTIAYLPGACWLVAAAAWGLVATPLGGPAYPEPPNTLQALLKVLLYMIIAAGIVAPSAFQPNRPTLAGTLLGNPLMRYLGRISYGIFLWQFVVIYAWYELTDRPYFKNDFWVVLSVVLPMTIIVATVSYYVLEKPAMAMKDWVSKDAARWSVMLPESAPEPAPAPPRDHSPRPPHPPQPPPDQRRW